MPAITLQTWPDFAVPGYQGLGRYPEARFWEEFRRSVGRWIERVERATAEPAA